VLPLQPNVGSSSIVSQNSFSTGDQKIYGPEKRLSDADFEPIGMVASLPVVITARKDLPPNDLKEFIAYAKVNAEKLNVAYAGVGSITHFTCLLLNSLLDVKPTLVPFNGAAPAVNALLAGQVDYMCCTIPEVVHQAQGGTVKAYAVGTAQRNPTLPNVPTSKEAGLPAFEASAWNALFAPKGTRRRSSTSSPRRSTKRSTTRPCVSACSTSAWIFRTSRNAASNSSLSW
jgi:tripartite-type tricarboxylate transporter receptor subunit TctC